ncbi:MAG TPA: S8 family serine peptidase [Pyrinomonadaceae bacterium]|nr:S8 family serine peptidase [Pyrinomonadaceae bacterium]
MKLVKTILSSVILLLAVSFGFGQKQNKNFVDGEVLVKFKSKTSASAIMNANNRFGASLIETLGDLNWVRVRLPNSLTVENAVAEYKNLDEVAAVQPNFYYHLLATPNDPQFTATGMWGLNKISAPTAWDFSTGSSTVVVADIDTGLRYTHDDIAANAWTNSGEILNNGVDDDGNGFVDDYYGWDFFYNDSNPIDDAGGHGTHTGGTIGAVGNNLIGVTGVNWNVKIMPIKIYSPLGTDSTSAMLVNAYNYVRMMKLRGVNIRVTNNSYGGCGEACGYDQATKDALDAMGNAGILNVFAAGNDNVNIENTPSYPASYTSPSVLSVASSTSTDARSSFSNYGTISVDLAAPGSSVLSTYASSNTSYATLSGTSMATPHVTGAAALLSAYNPNLSVASLKATLMNTVDPLTNWTSFVKTGGRLNVARALQNQTVCTFTSPDSAKTVSTSGGSFSMSIKAAQNCDYEAKSSVSWIQISNTAPLSGNGTVTFQVSANTGGRRTGNITIGGQIYKITQP